MSEKLCDRCTSNPATSYGVPMEAARTHSPDGRRYDPQREVVFIIEPQTWGRFCETCIDALIGERKLIGAFDIATWKDPREHRQDPNR